MKILVFGNPLLKQDSLPLKLLPKLRLKFPNIDFQEIDPTENLEPFLNTDTPNTEHRTPGDLVAIDTIKSINKITIINDINQLHANKIYSMHDFDLALNLKLLKKLNIIESVKIIGIPMDMSEEEALVQISKLIPRLNRQLQLI